MNKVTDSLELIRDVEGIRRDARLDSAVREDGKGVGVQVHREILGIFHVVRVRH